jgi:hypothetical protein
MAFNEVGRDGPAPAGSGSGPIPLSTPHVSPPRSAVSSRARARAQTPPPSCSRPHWSPHLLYLPSLPPLPSLHQPVRQRPANGRRTSSESESCTRTRAKVWPSSPRKEIIVIGLPYDDMPEAVPAVSAPLGAWSLRRIGNTRD